MWKTNFKEDVLNRTYEMEEYIENINNQKFQNQEELSFEKNRINKFINFTINLLNNEIENKNETYNKYEDPTILKSKNKKLLETANNYFNNYLIKEETTPLQQHSTPLPQKKITPLSNNNDNTVYLNKNIINNKPKKEINSNDIIAKVFTIIGLLLLLGSSIALFAANYEVLPDWSKGAIVALMGLLLTGYGCFNCRKESNLFGCSIMSGGISIIFTSIVLSGFYLGIVDPYILLLLTLFTALLSIFLALKYDSQLVAIFSILGGYIPILKLGALENSYILLVYFLIIAIISIIIFSKRKWDVLKYISMIMSAIVVTFTGNLLLNEWNDYYSEIIACIYALIFFILYSSVPLINYYLNDESKFSISNNVYDILLSGIYTMIFLSIENILFIPTGLYYIFISIWMDKKIENPKISSDTLFVIGVTFILSTITDLISENLLPITWAIEALLFAIRGYFKNKKILKTISWIVLTGSIIAFLIASENLSFGFNENITKDIITAIISYISIVAIHFTMNEFMKKDTEPNNITQNIFRVISYLFSLFIFIFISGMAMELFVSNSFNKDVFRTDIFDIEIFVSQIAITITCLYISFLTIKSIKDEDKVILLTTNISSFIMLLFSLFFSAANPIEYYRMKFFLEGDTYYTKSFNFNYEFMNVLGGLIFLIGITLLMYITISVFIKTVLRKNTMTGQNIAILSTSLYALFTISIKISSNLFLLENTDMSNIILSIIYLIIAAYWITKGLTNNFNVMKIFGLVLSGIALLKICIFDTSFMEDNTRPIVYIICAIVCFVIVKIYTSFSKKQNNK